MVKTLMSPRFIQTVLLPGWIFAFGLATLIAPPMGVAASLSIFLVGVVFVPALVITLRPTERIAVNSSSHARD